MHLTLNDTIIDIPFAEEPYYINLKPGKYLLEAYGASGGGGVGSETTARDHNGNGCLNQNYASKGNTECKRSNSQPGSGGYASGIFITRSNIPMYILTGGKVLYGEIEFMKGGFNGGGSACATHTSSGSGGGATDFRLFRNSLFTRILVAGGGGGSDDYQNGIGDDGSGGSGGLPGQAMWINGVYQGPSNETTTTKGFTFGQGQRSQACNTNEQAGAGGGFFGGYSFYSNAGGASGGSSFAFSKDIPYPKDLIEATDEDGNLIEKTYYALDGHPEYYLREVSFATGIWSGNGHARITFLQPISLCSNNIQFNFFPSISSLVFIFINS